ncbi:MAG: hypothetical protein Q8P15_03680 [Nanoarchaeota archaeon]|nr:hypothetical protein [Nanoarchaeota archaeon]
MQDHYNSINSPTLEEFISEPLGISFKEVRRISSDNVSKTIFYSIAIVTETARTILKTADIIGRNAYYI